MADRHRRHKTTDVNEGLAPSARLAEQSEKVENLIQFHQESISEKRKATLKEKLSVVTLCSWQVSERAQEVKQERAQGGCLGTESRRKT